MSSSRSSPPSDVRISRIRGEVEVRYVREVRLFSRARGLVVSSAIRQLGRTSLSGSIGRQSIPLRSYSICEIDTTARFCGGKM